MEKKKKFNQIWSNQTNLGKKFGLSAIAIGKLLIEEGLKDQKTRSATKKAIDEGYAKDTPLKDGTPYFMWNIEKVRPLIAKDHKKLSKVEFWVSEVKETVREAEKLDREGLDKVAYMIYDSAYDNVPKDIKEEVRSIIEKDE
ncbi:hypothetical protein BGV40_02860 [Methanosarcina sp. Ant1]|jgi:hypothetical protein|nr:hypothetical protein BGV40_02860 [Methanosarcina sp. Ant1]